MADPKTADKSEIVELLAEVRGQTREMGTAVKELIAFKDDLGRWKTSADERMGAVEGAIKLRGVSLTGLKDDKAAEKFVLGRAMRAIFTGDWKGAELERDILDQTKRAMSGDVRPFRVVRRSPIRPRPKPPAPPRLAELCEKLTVLLDRNPSAFNVIETFAGMAVSAVRGERTGQR